MLKVCQNKTVNGIRRPALTCMLALAVAAVFTLFPRVSGAGMLEINDTQVDSTFLFTQGKLTFSGSVDEDCQVIVKVIGSGKNVILGKNGLMPSNYNIVENLPGQYKIISSADLSAVSPEVKRTLAITGDFSGLGEAAAVYSWSEENKVRVEGNESLRLIENAVSENERSGRYKVIENGILVRDGKFSGSLPIARHELTPQVLVEIYAVKGEQVVDYKTRKVDLQGSILGKPMDIEKDPLLFAGFFFCLTVIAAVAGDEILGRGRKTAYR